MEQHTLPASTEIVTTGEHYRIEGEAGRGGSAYCYRARSLHDSNYWCVLKEFAPRDMRPFLQRQTPQGPLVLMQPWLRSEYDRQLKHFREEVDRCSEVNEGDGLAGNNSPCILRSHFVPERDDLLRVDTEQGCTVYEYVNRFRPKGGLTADYIALCLELMVRLMDGLRQIHKSHLHLDISPKNIYIITPEPPLKAGNTYSVKLFDLASAQRKDVFTAGKIDGLRAQNPCTTYTQGYTHYSLRDFWTELEYDPEAAKTHAAERPIDERVDLFSVGAVLLFMLTGNQQIVADGNTEAIGFIRMEKRRYAALLPLLQELIAGAMQQSVRYAEPSQCDVRFRDDLWNAQRAFLNEAGFSAIQIAGVAGRPHGSPEAGRWRHRGQSYGICSGTDAQHVPERHGRAGRRGQDVPTAAPVSDAAGYGPFCDPAACPHGAALRGMAAHHPVHLPAVLRHKRSGSARADQPFQRSCPPLVPAAGCHG